jgi:hypothetical protein
MGQQIVFVLRDFVVHFELHLHLGVWSFFGEQTRIPIGDVLALLTDMTVNGS